MKKFLHLLILLLLLVPFQIYAQCSSGETEVTITVHTDRYGSETTWKLTGSGGDPEYITSDPYTDGSEYHDVQTVCVPEGAELVFTIYDSYGDGMCAGYGDGYYTVELYDFVYAQGCDIGNEESTTFFAVPPPNTNLIFEELLVPKYVEYGDVIIQGIFRNYGINTITSVDINWTIDNETVNTFTINNLDIITNETDTLIHTTPWNTADSLKFYDLKVWTSNPNGVSDENPEDDTLALEIYVLDDVAQRLVLIEHFTNASCPPCASQNPILDSVITEVPGNLAKVSHLAYHTSWPGTDPMYTFNQNNGQDNARVSYYGVSGVPNAVVAGNKFQGSPAYVTTEMIDLEYAKPGLFNININPVFINDSILKVDLDITSLAEFKDETLKAHVVMVEDMNYATPPGTNGEKSFPDVMRYMIPEVEGIDIGLPKYGDVFSTVITQKIDTAIIKDYRFIVFIQDDNTKNIHMVSSVSSDITPPFVSISPYDGEIDIVLDQEITMSFRDPVRFIDDTEVVDPTSLITFKKDDATGENISFTASINTEKTKITITANNYMEINQHYHIVLSNSLEDHNDEAVGEHNITFKAMPPPSVEFSIKNDATDVIEDSIVITFSEPMRLINDDPITNPAATIILKKDNQSGDDVAFTASIYEDNTLISVTPDTYLDEQQAYYISINALVENKYDIVVEQSSSSFTTGEYPTVTATITPVNEVTDIARDIDISISFDLAVRLINDDPITDPASVITLKKDNQDGEDVTFAASINENKTLITINPDDNLDPEQDYYINIGALVENKYNKAIEETSSTFTTVTATDIGFDGSSYKLSVYPNPFKDKLYISYHRYQQEKVVIEIYNQTGVLVKTINPKSSIGNQEIEINTEDMSNGIYFFNLKINDNRISKKIVLLR